MCQIMTPRTCNFLLAFFLLLTKLQVCWFNFFALSPPLIPSRCSHMIQGFCYPLLLVSHSWKVHLNDFTWHSLLAKNEGGPQIHNLRQRGNNLWQRRHYQLFNFSATLQLYTSSRNQINQAFDISTKVVSDVRYESPVFCFLVSTMCAPDLRFSLETRRRRGRSWGAEEGGWPGWGCGV